MRCLLLIAIVATFFCSHRSYADDAASLEFFEREIRPILVNRCYECHDAETGADAANLRLDHRTGWVNGGDSGPAVNVEDPDASLLVKAILYDDPDLQMPPRGKLPEREIELLQKWIAEGAAGPEESSSTNGGVKEFDLEARRASHWAWQPVARPAVPEVQQTDWPHDDADRFVLAKLEAAGLAPAAATDRATWLRRVTFDLTGLPPTIGELKTFEADESPEARERVVDRLLASPAFGEHWGQHWLDLVRYAESKGHEQDYDIPFAWRYRDYIIRAFNANVPYDQLVIEHIAGDLMPAPRIDAGTGTNQSIQATGWWHLGEATHAPVDIRGEESDRIDNQIDVFGKTFLGMTVACARCHDHKFDAISADDYYALCGFLQSSSYQVADVADPVKQAELSVKLANLNDSAGRELFAKYAAATRDRLGQLLSEGQTPQPANVDAIIQGSKLRGNTTPQAAEGSVVVDFSQGEPTRDDWLTSGVAYGPRPLPLGTVVLSDKAEGPQFTIADRAAASNRSTSAALTGLYRTRTVTVTGKTMWYRYRGSARVFLDVDSHRTVASPLHEICQQTIESPGEWQWFAHDVSDYVDHRVHVDFKPTGEFELAGVWCSDECPQDAPAAPVEVFPVSTATPDASAPLRDAVQVFVRALDAVANGEPTACDAVRVNWLIANDNYLPPASEERRAEITKLHAAYLEQRQALESQVPTPEFALALMDGTSENEYVHLRGSHKRLAPEPTPRRNLSALGGHQPTGVGSGRMELAQRLVDPANPLVARVMVNRLWSHLMGRGIVATVDNLGVLGQPPTHPELLDYLASEFVAGGWDTKQMIRRMVLSSTYAQSTERAASIDAKLVETADPANHLLHKARVRRIPAEAIRDSLLAITGELDATPYGRSVPIHITDFMRHNRSPDWSGPMDGDRRRSVYVEVRRNAFNHFLAAFDKPAPFTTVGVRNQSNSAAQPLMLLNDPLVHELIAVWSTKLTGEFTSDSDAIERAYLAAFARPATETEQEQLLAFLNERTTVGASRQQAWQDLCLALVNSKEFVYLK